MKYKKIFFKFTLIIFLTLSSFQITKTSQTPSFTVQSSARQYEKIKCLLLIFGEEKNLIKLGKIIKYDLNFTDQLEVDLKKSGLDLDAKMQDNLFKQGTSLLLSIKQNNQENFKITLKDLCTKTIFFEKEFKINLNNLLFEGHKISDEILQILTGEKSICLNPLAYCKMVSFKHKIICISDYSCKKEKIVVPAKTVNIAPCWHTKAPILFYSQFTKINNRLMSIDLKTKQHKVVCSYDGLNMQPSFSQDGSKAVLCLSGGKNSELYLYDVALCKRKKREFLLN